MLNDRALSGCGFRFSELGVKIGETLDTQARILLQKPEQRELLRLSMGLTETEITAYFFLLNRHEDIVADYDFVWVTLSDVPVHCEGLSSLAEKKNGLCQHSLKIQVRKNNLPPKPCTILLSHIFSLLPETLQTELKAISHLNNYIWRAVQHAKTVGELATHRGLEFFGQKCDPTNYNIPWRMRYYNISQTQLQVRKRFKPVEPNEEEIKAIAYFKLRGMI